MVIYDILHQPYVFWENLLVDNLINFFALSSGVVLIYLINKHIHMFVRNFNKSFVFIFIATLAFFNFLSFYFFNQACYNKYETLKASFLKKEYNCIKGSVKNVVHYYGRINRQIFTIDGEKFEITDNEYTGGYNISSRGLTPFVEGRCLKICYVERFDNLKIVGFIEELKSPCEATTQAKPD